MSDAPPPPPNAPPPPPNPEQQPPESARDAKARAKGEKAYAKASRPWYKKKRFILPLATLVVIILAIVATGGGDGTDVADPGADDGDAAAEGEGEATTTGIGSAARDGRFEFTVSSFECGETTVGEDFMQEEAQGQFCLMEVTVENIGDESQFFAGDNQYVFNEEDTQYSASTEATFANNPEGDELFTEINPGNSVDGTIVFDIPEGAEVAYAELHDSPFSGGVRVELQ